MDTKRIPRVSVVIPVLNEETRIYNCLLSVFSQDYPISSFEVLVVDGGSLDDTKNIVLKFMERYSNIKLIHNPKKIIPSALNIGLKYSKGEIFIRVDGRTVLEKNYISLAVSKLDERIAENVGGLMRPVGISLIGKAISFLLQCPFGIGNGQFHYANEEKFVDTVYLGTYFRDLLISIGGYDENLAFAEDDEINLRIRKNGGKILLVPNLLSTYFCRNNYKQLSKQYFNYGKSKISVIKKYKKSIQLRHYAPPFLIIFLIVSALLIPFVDVLKYVLIFVFLVYICCCLYFAFSSKNTFHQSLLIMLGFPVLHFSYGLGMIYGFLK